MPKSTFISSNDGAFADQLQTFKIAIPSYAAKLDLTPAQIAAQAADADYFKYVIDSMAVMQQGSQQWTSWKDLVRAGGAPPAAGAPAAPVFPPAVAAVAPGIEARFRALVRQIKANGNYNAAMGEALGIEGAQQTGPDLTTIQPEIAVALSGNQVQITWGWGGNSAFLDLCEIEVDRGDTKGFVLLTYDSTPNYVDTASLPNTPTKWTYRAIYRVADHRVGQWSKPLSVTVGA
jgi:hypothetical protein